MNMLEKLWKLRKHVEETGVATSLSEHIEETQETLAKQPKEIQESTSEQSITTNESEATETTTVTPVIPLNVTHFTAFSLSHNSEKLQILQFSRSLQEELEQQHKEQEEYRKKVIAEQNRQKRAAIMQGSKVPNQDTKDEILIEETSKDADIRIFITDNKMSAFLTVLPPLGKGKDVTAEAIEQSVKKAGIVKIVDPSVFQRIEQEHLYLHVFQIGKGQLPVDGEAGSIVDHFPRKQELHLKEDEHGNIDYRNLGIFQNIDKGTLICDIIPPTAGTDGYDVSGRSLIAKAGKAAEIPKGQKTEISEDGTQLLAAASGNLIFEHNRFCIHEKLLIRSDVDAAIGNIDFPGDVEITGDVHNGFTIKSGGSISIRGIVENAQIIAEENVHIANGMKGGVSGSVNAGGEITSKFFENCTIYSKSNIHAESFLNCRLYTDQTIDAEKGKGIIIGCDITANTVQAKSIGSPSGHLTKIELSHSYLIAQDLKEAEKELSITIDLLDKINKNIKFLSTLEYLDAKKKAVFQQLIDQKRLYDDKKLELDDTIASLKEQISEIQLFCQVRANTLFAPVQISYGSIIRHIDSTIKMCSIYFDDQLKEIVIGTL